MRGRSLFIAVITEVAAVLILRIFLTLVLVLLLPITAAFLLSTAPVMSSICDIHGALPSYHTPFIVLAVFHTKTLQFIPRGICIADS